MAAPYKSYDWTDVDARRDIFMNRVMYYYARKFNEKLNLKEVELSVREVKVESGKIQDETT